MIDVGVPIGEGNLAGVRDDLDTARLLQSSSPSLAWLGREACSIILPLSSEAGLAVALNLPSSMRRIMAIEGCGGNESELKSGRKLAEK